MQCPLQEIAIKYIAKYPDNSLAQELGSVLQLTTTKSGAQDGKQTEDSNYTRS